VRHEYPETRDVAMIPWRNGKFYLAEGIHCDISPECVVGK
jgi:hypothetical protein